MNKTPTTERIIMSYLLLTKIRFNAITVFNRFSCIFGAAVAVVVAVANTFYKIHVINLRKKIQMD